MKKFLLLTTMLCGWMGSAMAEELPANYITVKSETASVGAVTVTLDMVNEATFTPCAFQCDITGATFDNAALELAVGTRNSGHTIVSNVLSNGTLRIVCYSMTNAAITGTEGTVATFKTNLSKTTEFTVTNIVIADKESVSKKAEELKGTITIGGDALPGDFDGSGDYTINDLTILMEFFNASDPAGDLDGSGDCTINDVTILMNYILGK